MTMNLFHVNFPASGRNAAMAFALLTLVTASLAWSDEVVLTDKRKVTGKILEETSASLRVRTNKGDLNIPKNRVQSVSKQETSKAESEGDLLVIKQDYYSALSSYQKGLAEQPENARIAAKVKDAEEKIIQKEKGLYDELFQKGMEQSSKRDHAGARVIFKQIMDRVPPDSHSWKKARRAIAFQYYLEYTEARDRVDYTQGIQALEQATKTDPTLAAVWVELARSYDKHINEKQKALEAYRSGIDLGRTELTWDKNVRDDYRSIEPKEAMLDQAVINQARYELAELQFMTGNRQEAAEDFLQLLTEDPKSFAKSTKYIVEAYTDPKMKMDHTRMQEQLDVALKLDPASAPAWKLKGQIYLDDKQTTQAVVALTNALQKDTSMPQAHAMRAEAYLLMKDPISARKDLEAELEHGPTYDLNYRLGMILLEGSEYDEALKHFNKAIAMDSEKFSALLGRARTHRLMAASASPAEKETHLNAADKDLQTILDKNPTMLGAVLEKASLLRDKKNYEEAAKYFGDVITELTNKKDLRTPAENDLLATAYCERGDSNLLQTNPNQALDDFNQALKVKPDFALAYNKIGQVSEKSMKYPEAKSNYLRAIEISPLNADFELSAGILCQNYLRQYQEAIDHYQAFIKKGGVDSRVKAWIGQCQLSLSAH